MKLLATLTAAAIFICAYIYWSLPKNSHLRGNAVDSKDGKTYLAVDDTHDPGGPCTLDGKAWTYKQGEPGEIAPGVHQIKCGHSGQVEFEVPPKVIFHFNYWGP